MLILIKNVSGIKRIMLDDLLRPIQIDYERDNENLDEAEICDNCGDELDDEFKCPNCDFFEAERDAWTPND